MGASAREKGGLPRRDTVSKGGADITEFPIAQDKEDDSSTGKVPAGARADTILFIENDEDDLHDLLSIWKPPIPVTLATNGSEAMQRLDEYPPALVVLDLDLTSQTGGQSAENGIALLDLIRSKLPETVPIIVISSLRRRFIGKCRTLRGISHFVEKPLSLEKLDQAVRKHLIQINRSNSTKGGAG